MSKRNKKVTIVVCCHKRDIMATQPPYMPIHVGKALSKADLGIQGDNTGDNISKKNASYCELTGMYWAWKNLKGCDVVGLCHYRRYFDFHHQCRRILDIQTFKTSAFNTIDLSVPVSITDNLRDGTAIVPKKKYYMANLYYDYCFGHVSDDLRTLENLIKEKYPTYWPAFHKIMWNNNALMHYNMFLMTYHDFNNYCSWLFPLLAEMEQRTNIKHYSTTQQRIFGYMAERLFNIWLYAHHFNLHHHNIIWFNDQEPNPSTLNKLYKNLAARLISLPLIIDGKVETLIKQHLPSLQYDK